MYNRIIRDIYHLQRIHTIIGDAGLFHALQQKLRRLNLRPALEELAQLQRISGGTISAAAVGGGGGASASSGASSPSLLPDPTSLVLLLECMVHLRLADTALAADAMQLTEASLPLMSPAQLGTTIAACCALGQEGLAVSASALLLRGLRTAASPPTASTRPSSGASGVSPNRYSEVDDGQLRFTDGNDFLLLLQTLVRHNPAAMKAEEEVWRVIAEHAVRILPGLSGEQVLRIVELLSAMEVDYHKDFYVALQAHVVGCLQRGGSGGAAAGAAAPPHPFITVSQMEQLIEHLKGLDVSVLALQSAYVVAHDASLDGRFAVAAAAVASASPASKAEAKGTTSATRTRMEASATAAAPSFPDVSHVALFTETSLDFFATAEAEELLTWLRRCLAKEVMNPAVMAAAVATVQRLYTTSASTTASTMDGAVLQLKPEVLATRLPTLLQTLLTLLSFTNPTFFGVATAPKAAQHEAEEGEEGDGEAAPTPAAAATAAPLRTLAALLDATADAAHSADPPQLVHIASLYLALFPLPKRRTTAPETSAPQPIVFYKEVVRLVERAKSISDHVGTPARLLELVRVLMALGPLGGHQALAQHLSPLAVAATNAPRRVQTELLATIAPLPAAQRDLLPSLLRSLSDERGWQRGLSPTEVGQLLAALRRGRVQDPAVLRDLADYFLANLRRFEPAELVAHLHTFALLGVREVELYVAAAEHVLAATQATRRPTTVHDLSLLLYVFTFTLKGVIKVVQQAFARLKVAAGRAAPQDVVLALYTMAHLHVGQQRDVAKALTDRATATLAQYRPAQLASVWASLAALQYGSEGLLAATQALLEAEATAPTTGARHFPDVDFVRTCSSVMSVCQGTARQRRAPSLVPGQRPAGPPAEPWRGSATLQAAYTAALLRVLEDPKQTMPGLTLYHALQAQGWLPTPLPLAAWAVLAVRADHAAAQLAAEPDDAPGIAAARTLVLLGDLHAAADKTHQQEGSAWLRLTAGWGSPPLPPKLIAHVAAHREQLQGMASLKESLRRVGALAAVLGDGREVLARARGRGRRAAAAPRPSHELRIQQALQERLQGAAPPPEEFSLPPTPAPAPTRAAAPTATNRTDRAAAASQKEEELLAFDEQVMQQFQVRPTTEAKHHHHHHPPSPKEEPAPVEEEEVEDQERATRSGGKQKKKASPAPVATPAAKRSAAPPKKKGKTPDRKRAKSTPPAKVMKF